MKRTMGIMVMFVMLGALLIAGCSGTDGAVTIDNAEQYDVTVFKSATCGCCMGYVAALEKQGFKVNVISTQDMDSIKEKYGIPGNMKSCHTSIIGDYFVEGHVPMEAVEKLLTEKPDVEGIALPRMPSGSPGMPGGKTGVWTIYSLKDNAISEFMQI